MRFGRRRCGGGRVDWLILRRSVGHKGPYADGDGDAQSYSDHQKVDSHGYVERDHSRANQRSGDSANAESRVEARHDGAAKKPFHGGALNVHGDVPGSIADSEEEQRNDDEHSTLVVANGDPREGYCSQDRHHRESASRPNSRDNGPGER